jgi:hypothetical protein
MELIIDIISAVFPLDAVWSAHVIVAVGITRILCGLIDDPLEAPVTQICKWCRPSHIVVDAEIRTIEGIVTSIYIEPAAEDVRLTIGNILPTG